MIVMANFNQMVQSDFINIQVGTKGCHSAILKTCEFNGKDTFRGILEKDGIEVPYTFIYVSALNTNPDVTMNFFYWSDFKDHYKELIEEEVDIEYTCLDGKTLHIDSIIKHEDENIYDMVDEDEI